MDEEIPLCMTPYRSPTFLPVNMCHISQSFATYYTNAYERIKKRYHTKKNKVRGCTFTPWKQVIGFHVPGSE